MAENNVMLSVQDLEVYYGSIHAIKKISFDVREGEIVTLIGANGAGKTTTLHAISGLVKARSGEISFCGSNLRSMEAHKIIRLGLAQVPEGRRIFASMTVQENLEMGAYIRRDRDKIQQDYERIFDRLPRLKERRRQIAGTLSGGEQQMLAVGRALLSRPELLMMDEPSLGLAPLIIKDIFNIIQYINSKGMTILLIEQNANMALKVAHRAYVLETGKITMSGTGAELLENPEIKAAYLGKKKK